MKTILLVALLAAGCNRGDGSTYVEETPPAKDAISEEVKEEPKAPIESETEVVDTRAPKLRAHDCIDPLLSYVLKGTKITMCDGTVREGFLVLPDLSPLQPESIKAGVTIAGVTGTYSAPDLSNLTEANVRSGVTIAGVTGTYVGTVLPANCSSNAQVGCITTETFLAADLSALTAANIRKGVTVAGVAGDYPSYANPLSSSTTTPDLDDVNFTAKIKSDSEFEWFDARGNRYARSGSSMISAENILSGVTIFNITGSLEVTLASDIDPWNVRKGTTVNGVVGKLDAGCAVVPTKAPYDYQCGQGSQENLGGGTSADGGAFMRFRDRISNRVWQHTVNYRDDALRKYSAAVAYCSAIGDGWRLPTLYEVRDLQSHDLYINSSGWSGQRVWSSTVGKPYTGNPQGPLETRMAPTLGAVSEESSNIHYRVETSEVIDVEGGVSGGGANVVCIKD